MIDVPAEENPLDVRIARGESPGGTRVAILTLDNGEERRPETLGPVGLSRLDAAITEAVSGGAEAIIITGNGRTFCAGANLDTLSTPRHFGDALQIAQEGHRVLGRLSQLDVPTIAAINGTALGGGLELALHCSHRVTHDRPVALGLPEIGLGLIPGWGGATLLPRLIGMPAALTVMVDNAIAGRFLDGAHAHALGIVDRVAENVLDGALALVDELPDTARPNLLSDDDSAAIAATFGKALSRPGNPVDALTHLQRIVERAQLLSTVESFEAEDAALADLTMTAEFRRRLYAFRVTSGASRQPSGSPDATPRPITCVGVVGAGLMASQIALVLADRLDVPVRITDVDQSRLDAAGERISGWLDARVGKGSLALEDKTTIEQRIVPTLDLAEFSDCDLVIEAVFEDLDVKKDVFGRLDAVVRPSAILATNTSSLSVDAIASFVADPSRVAGIHFFNPVAAMKLVEVVRGPRIGDEILATAIDVTRRLGKTPVIVSDESGFVVNRLLSVFLGESLRLVETGVPTGDITAALRPLRLPMSPFALIDLIGRVVTLKMLESLERFAPDRFFVGEQIMALAHDSTSVPIEGQLTEAVPPSRELGADDIHDTIVDALAREVRIMLDSRVVSTVTDVDLCMMNGAGWPSAIGGLTPYLDGCGASERATGGLFHPEARFD